MAKHKMEHKDGKRHERKKGGSLPEAFVEHEDGKKKKMAHHAHKSGGHVDGKHAMHRPDRRARGGATSDSNPLTTAGKMSSMPFEKKQAPEHDDHGEGADRE